MADYYRDVVARLREGGFEFKRQGRGDHEIWWNPRTQVRVTVDKKLPTKSSRMLAFPRPFEARNVVE